MEKIKQQYWAMANNYARQFGEVIGYDVDSWIGDKPELCQYSDIYYFTLDEIRTVIDNLDKYVERYGSREAVGQEVRDWQDWWMEGVAGSVMLERIEPRITHQLRPNINLRAWLDGCPRTERTAWEGPDADYLRLKNDIDMVERLIGEFRDSRSLGNVLANLQARFKVEEERKKERDIKEWQAILDSQAGREFKKAVEEHTGNPF